MLPSSRRGSTPADDEEDDADWDPSVAEPEELDEDEDEDDDEEESVAEQQLQWIRAALADDALRVAVAEGGAGADGASRLRDVLTAVVDESFALMSVLPPPPPADGPVGGEGDAEHVVV